MPPQTPSPEPGLRESIDVITRSEADTAAIGARLAQGLRPGAIIHLFGDLGAGKTVFVRGLVSGLGLDPDEVSSPTFTLIQEYRGPVTFFHVDLYRLASAEVSDLELDAFTADGIVAIEWADRLPAPDARAIIVRIDDAGDDERRVRVDLPAPPR